MNAKKQSEVDAYLESLIAREHAKLIDATCDDDRRNAWHSMRALIGSRSPFQIRRMEIERGLR